MIKRFVLPFLILFGFNCFSQNIKSIQLRPTQENNYSSIVPLGTVLELSFDDLEADAKDYQYKIQHMTHDWKESRLLSSQYIDGFDSNTIIDVTNSFNTFQSYSHYSVKIPNINTVITKSGNYLLSVLDEYDDVVFTRRFVLYENAATVGVSVSRSRNAKKTDTQQTVEFLINHPKLRINNPSQEINVVVLKNENWNESISGLQPTFFQQNQLKYTYTNKTNFWGGNEYLNFDSKFIRNKSVNVVKIEMKDLFHQYLYPYTYNPYLQYKYNPDINGQFIIRTLEANDPNTEADYAKMHFTLFADEPFINKDVYVFGGFNNFKIDEDCKMTYNTFEKSYKAEILLKQGFYNYTFATVDENEDVNTNEINGTFFQTENQYIVIAYFKPFGGLYDRVIAVGKGQFNQNRWFFIDLWFLVKKGTFTLMVEQITKGIKISVKTQFNGTSYRNNRLYYVFAYFITIENNSLQTVKLKDRFWNIFDSLNKTEIVQGEGVVGQTPVLKPNDIYSYSSGCFLESNIGAMNGFYTMIDTETFDVFKVAIPTFQLTTTVLSN